MQRTGQRAVASVLAVAVTACGGGGGVDDPVVDPPGPLGIRQAALSYDFDNNGVVDAVQSLVYDAAGRVVERRFVRTNSVSSDKFDPVEDEIVSIVESLTYDAQSRLVANSSPGLRFSHIYDGSSALALRTEISADGSALGTWAYTYSGNLMTQAQRTTVFGNSVDTFAYDAQGRRLSWLESGEDSATVQTAYTWNSDGKLVMVDREVDSEGGRALYTMAYAGGRQTGTVKTVDGAPSYSVAFTYDAQGRLLRAEFDDGSNGSVDAVWTLTWETGACVAIRLPEFDPLMDSISGYGSSSDGTVSNCGP